MIRYEITDNSVLTNPKVIWRASDSKTDTHHVNSIAHINGEVIVSAFGPKNGKSWKTATNGYIYNITKGCLVKDGIHQPHSLSVRNGKIYYCASFKGAFLSIDDDNPIFTLGGYTRGVTWLSDEYVCVATSTRIKIPKYKKLMNFVFPHNSKNENKGQSRIFVGNSKTKELLHSSDLSYIAPEVYDLMAVRKII